MSMLLKGSNGNEFELAFTHDALPDAQDGFGDSKWSTVTFRAATADDSWEEDSPAINLFEFANLAEWLEAVGRGDTAEAGDSPEVSALELLGPELSFSLSGNDKRSVTLRIGFHLRDRPEEFEVDAETDEAEYIDIHLPRVDLLAAAQALRADLKAVDSGTNKDDLQGEDDSGAMGVPDEDLALIDRISAKPPGAGRGEDNAGNR